MTLHRRLPQLRLVAEVAMEMLEEKVKMEVWRPGSQVALGLNTVFLTPSIQKVTD